MDKNKRKKIILILLLVILVVALLLVIGFLTVIFSLQNSGELIEFEMTVDPGPVREFIVDSFESMLPKN